MNRSKGRMIIRGCLTMQTYRPRLARNCKNATFFLHSVSPALSIARLVAILFLVYLIK